VDRIWAAIECVLKGERQLEAKDDTLTEGGRIGVWTKANAQTIFDKLEVNSVK
jgi:hypothetical protein